MIRTIAKLLAALGLVVAVVASVNASEFEFRLKIDLTDRPHERSVSTDQTTETPTASEPPRPLVKLLRDKPVSVSWHAENTSKSDEFADVLVHFFVVKETKTGQRDVPKLTEDVTYEGALTMDFKPHDDADWHWILNIHDPGNYLLRVETIGMQEQHGHDHYAAMDLVVQ